MKSDEAVTHSPELEPIREDLLRLKLMWIFCCVSPILYLILARFISSNFFNDADHPGLFPLDPHQYRAVMITFAAAALLLQPVIFLIRSRFAKEMRRRGGHAVRLMQIYWRRTFALFAVCEATIFLGFLLFILNGRLSDIVIFGSLGLVYYAQSYPSESGLRALAR